MKYISIFLLAAIIFSCNNEGFINHKFEFKKLGECTSGEKAVSMVSNIAGERYKFESCLDANFDGKNYKVERMGDSIVVSFGRGNGDKAAFEITIDIDANPPYHHIILDGKEILVNQQ